MFHVKHSVWRLEPGDEKALERFLRRHVESSMLLLSNLSLAGLAFDGHPYQGEYFAAMDGDAIRGVVAHAWNGMVVCQAPDHTGQLAMVAVTETGRAIAGLVGPWHQVVEIRAELGLAGRPTALDSCEDLFALDLSALLVPEQLRAGEWVVRPPRPDEHDRLVAWRLAYRIEALGEVDGPKLREGSADDVERLISQKTQFVLIVDNEMVAAASFNAGLPDLVQIGGVWTPPELRGRGYGRAVVAGALQLAVASGVRRATLFTDVENEPAQHAYRGLGFVPIGHYGLVLFK
jgi:ribosomal protein S18 acetylase RimI-like enzyme